ncbi:hypothetical protein DVH05_005645 [Phytophthora capsici]|nr:hypothetical protein DVH05_005645 [Phytophthora capsici]
METTPAALTAETTITPTRSRSPGETVTDAAGSTTGSPSLDGIEEVPGTTQSTDAGATRKKTGTGKSKPRRGQRKTVLPSDDDGEETDSPEEPPARSTAARTIMRIVAPSAEEEETGNRRQGHDVNDGSPRHDGDCGAPRH